jgi:hypothetical protein
MCHLRDHHERAALGIAEDEGDQDGCVVCGSLYYTTLSTFARMRGAWTSVGVGVSLRPMIVVCELLIP